MSLGGLVALELARRGAVASATAFSPAGFAAGRQRAWLDGSLRATKRTLDFLEPRLERVLAAAPVRRAAMAQMIARADRVPAVELAGHLRAVTRSDFDRTRVALVAYDFPAGPPPGVPVTIAWGSRDLLLFPRQARRAVARIPGARRVPLPGTSHIPTYDDPDAVVRVIRETTAQA
jgi:pimeloyl-ACP methyl ester carboxylesterase